MAYGLVEEQIQTLEATEKYFLKDFVPLIKFHSMILLY
jgi:hypothetical protein